MSRLAMTASLFPLCVIDPMKKQINKLSADAQKTLTGLPLPAPLRQWLQKSPENALVLLTTLGAMFFIIVYQFVSAGGQPPANALAPANQQAEQQAVVRTYPIQDEASFSALTRVFHMTPLNDPALEFDINLPNEWTVENIATDTTGNIGRKILGDIGRISSPLIGIHRAVVTVKSVRIPHEITAGAWLQTHIMSNSHILQDKIDSKGAARAFAYYTSIHEGQVMLSYATAQFNGAQAVLASFEIPLGLKDELGFIQKRAIESFKLSNLQNTPVEEQKTFTLADAVKFAYPSSWQILPADYRDPNRISVQLMNRSASGITQGYIQIFAIRRRAETNLRGELEFLRALLIEKLDLYIEKMLISSAGPKTERFSFSRREAYTSTGRQNRLAQQIELVVLGNADFYIFAVLLTPDPAREIYNGARNLRSFDLISRSIQ